MDLKCTTDESIASEVRRSTRRKAVNAIPINQVDEANSETSISIGNIALTNTPPQSEGTKILVKSIQEDTREPPTDTECIRAETTTTNSQPH